MKIDRIKYGKSFRIGLQDIWERIDIEATVDNSESINTCMDELKKEVEFTHRLLNPGLYVNVDYSAIPGHPMNGNHIPAINKEAERIEIAIDNCETPEDLHLLQNDAIKHGLVVQFIEKKKKIQSLQK